MNYKSSYQFNLPTHIDMSKKPFDEIFDCSIKQQTQSTLSMNAFAACALLQSRFKRPVVKVVHTRLDQTVNEWRLKVKIEGFYIDRKCVYLISLSIPPSLSDATDCMKHCKNGNILVRYKQKSFRLKLKGLYYFTSSDLYTSVISLRQNACIPDLPGNLLKKVIQQPLPLPISLIFSVLQSVKNQYT